MTFQHKPLLSKLSDPYRINQIDRVSLWLILLNRKLSFMGHLVSFSA